MNLPLPLALTFTSWLHVMLLTGIPRSCSALIMPWQNCSTAALRR
jgi:hypothetical protein